MKNYKGAPRDGGVWQEKDCALRVLRGGSWSDGPGDVRSAYRDRYHQGDRDNNIGFRLAQDL